VVRIEKAFNCFLGDILVTKTKGHTGIIVSAPAPLLGRKATVTASTLHVRRGPAKTYAHVRYLHKGDPVTVYDEVSGWGRIGTNEWASLKYLK
jgi:SH3-like domain-containing protein